MGCRRWVGNKSWEGLMRLLRVMGWGLVLLTARAVFAQDYGSSDYLIERWDEDYSNLKPPAARPDFFDPIKYVPLDLKRDWYLSFGGQVRERADYFNNTEFGA